MAKRTRKPIPPTITEQLKAAITDHGLNVNQLAKETGIAQPILHRFMSGERDLKLETVDRLAAHLGLVLVEQRKPVATPSTGERLPKKRPAV